MKISKYFMVAAASIMMFGCAKNEDVRSHFRVPSSCLVSEMNTCF